MERKTLMDRGGLYACVIHSPMKEVHANNGSGDNFWANIQEELGYEGKFDELPIGTVMNLERHITLDHFLCDAETMADRARSHITRRGATNPRAHYSVTHRNYHAVKVNDSQVEVYGNLIEPVKITLGSKLEKVIVQTQEGEDFQEYQVEPENLYLQRMKMKMRRNIK